MGYSNLTLAYYQIIAITTMLKMKNQNQTGFYLIEILISIFLVSIGLLCAAGLQLTALQIAHQSSLHTLGMQLAADMANQIRAHNELTKQNGTINPYLNLNYLSGDEMSAPMATCYGTKNNCQPTELASFSVYEWERRIKEALPHGRATICRDSDPWDSTGNHFKWECNGSSSERSPIVVKLGWYEKKMNQPTESSPNNDFYPLIALVVGT
jgi:type IV pilus assembly protein PilV